MIWQAAVGATVAVASIAGAYVVGTRHGYVEGRAVGYTDGHDDGVASANQTHETAVARLNKDAADAQLAALKEQDAKYRAKLSRTEKARAAAAAELARVNSDRGRFTERVQSLLSAVAAGSDGDKGCDPGVPGAAASAARIEAAKARGLLLERIGKNLAGLVEDADSTLSQYQLCSSFTFEGSQ